MTIVMRRHSQRQDPAAVTMWRRHALRTALAFAMVLGVAADLAAQTETVTYFHIDAIGSVRMITDATGAVVERHDYLPFGEEWLPPSPNPERRLYGGKERDSESGFDYLGSRYYASQAGRFTAVDPVLDVANAMANPQLWNRYGYALNNPLSFTDNDGRSATLVGGLIGAAVGGGAALLQGQTWRQIGAAAAGGAVSGAMLGSVIDTGGASLSVLLSTGALAGVEGRLVENAINGRITTVQDAALNALAGTAGVAAGEVMLAGAQAISRVGAATVRSGSTSVADLEATHGMTMSGREFARLKADIAKNGVQDPIKYVEYNGQKFVVDGHHRLRAAQALGMPNVPSQRVDLPYAGYQTPEDLINMGR